MMHWIETKRKQPSSPGLYGILVTSERWDPDSFSFAYWDGRGWKIPSQSDISSRYIPIQYWCVLEIGKDFHG